VDLKAIGAELVSLSTEDAIGFCEIRNTFGGSRDDRSEVRKAILREIRALVDEGLVYLCHDRDWDEPIPAEEIDSILGSVEIWEPESPSFAWISFVATELGNEAYFSSGPLVRIHPVTPDRWDDLERLFGPSGASYGCWCMWFRRRSSEMAKSKARDNKADIKSLVKAGDEPGLIAYVDGEPAGWVSLDRKDNYPRLVHSTSFKRLALDDEGSVWSVVCFVVGKQYRRTGLSAQLLQGAIDYATKHGAKTLEAYPVEPTEELKGDRGYHGVRSVFDRAGFTEVARDGRPVMRLELAR
jgi:GNAT superfamily N-acetyltransferase